MKTIFRKQNETILESKQRVFHTPINCPACGNSHTYQQVKDAGGKCPETEIKLTVFSGINTNQYFEIFKATK